MSGWLLLRGLGRERRHWGTFPDALSARTGEEVHCLDLPGLGTERGRNAHLSMKPIVFDLRRRWLELPGPPAWVIGLSMGGMVALDWSARFPDDLLGVVAINSSSRDGSHPLRRFGPRPGARLVLGALRRSGVARELDVLRVTSRTRRGDRDLARAWAEFPKPSKRVVLAQVAAAASFEAPKNLGTPALVLSSAGDHLVQSNCGRAMAEALGPLARFRLHPAAGHDLPLDAPDWVLEEITAWREAHP